MAVDLEALQKHPGGAEIIRFLRVNGVEIDAAKVETDVTGVYATFEKGDMVYEINLNVYTKDNWGGG
jgi:hypothetical protein